MARPLSSPVTFRASGAHPGRATLQLMEQRDYIRAMARSGSITRTSGGIGDYIRRQRRLANISLHKMAEQSGISAAVLKEIENGLRNPSRAIVQSIASALRLSAETLQLQAGVLDPRDAEDVDTVREIRRDANLTERQREVLVEIYEAFCAANRANSD